MRVKSKAVLRRPAAVSDIIELADYISLDSQTAAERFLLALEDSLDLLARQPKVGTERELPNGMIIRWWRVRGFAAHLISYREPEAHVEILRVLHGARDIGAILEEEPEA